MRRAALDATVATAASNMWAAALGSMEGGGALSVVDEQEAASRVRACARCMSTTPAVHVCP